MLVTKLAASVLYYILHKKAASVSVKSNYKTPTSEGSYATFWGLTAPFLPPRYFFEPLYIYGPRFVRHRAGHMTLIAAEVGRTVLLTFIKTYRASFL
jgi:hypothetical protein